MTDLKVLEKVKKLLKKHNQGHLLTFWEQLNDVQRQNLLAQIEELDFSKIDNWVASCVEKAASTTIKGNLKPAWSYAPDPVNEDQKQKYTSARVLGEQLISTGKVGAFVVAGGQGTRLGFDGPKGDFPISPVRGKTLFRIFSETIAAVSKKYKVVCPWYIMTSFSNHNQTLELFESNDYYGLDSKNVFIFQQGQLPSFSLDGKILMSDKAAIASSPDGHGGSLKALYKQGALEDMKRRGIEFVSYFQVDNPLVKIFDPLFIGLHVLDKAQMSSKAVIKTEPKERVGVFCLVNGKVTVIEYSDLPYELAEKRTSDGSLVFGLGSIAIHIINTDFIEKLNEGDFSMPLHRAVKRIPHINQQGEFVEPDQPNGVKLESFIFDALPLTSESIILQIKRDQEFAPVKDATGSDSPKTARQIMIARAADWLESAGCTIPKKSDGSVDAIIEIAPGFALEKDDIKAKLDRIPEIRPGDTLYLQ